MTTSLLNFPCSDFLSGHKIPTIQTHHHYHHKNHRPRRFRVGPTKMDQSTYTPHQLPTMVMRWETYSRTTQETMGGINTHPQCSQDHNHHPHQPPLENEVEPGFESRYPRTTLPGFESRYPRTTPPK